MSMENVTSTGKDTIYVDVDDEITTIIDKVRSSHARIVALVLPKRAPVLQSIVNMKLLKRNAETAKKHLVLITSEASLMPLAGAVDMYVAKTLQSKPEVPEVPDAPGHLDDDDDKAVHLDNETPAVASARKAVAAASAKDKEKPNAGKSVGELAAGTIAAEAVDDAIDLDNDADIEPLADKSGKSKREKKPKGDKKLRIPNFDKFRVLLVAGGVGLVALIVLFVICIKVLPKATVTIDTNRQAVNISPSVTLNTAANSVNTSSGVVPAQSQTVSKTLTGTANTTGQQNNGTAASGTITMSAQECAPNLGQPASIPKGTGVTAGGQTYITQQTTTFSMFGSGKGSCETYNATSGPTPITAQNAGKAGNTSGNNVSFTVSGRSDINANGSASGGTDNIIQVVAQADIDSATSKIAAQDTNSVKQQLESSLTAEGSTPIEATFTASTPTPSPSAAVGAQATSVTVTEQITYTMLGARKNDLQQIVKAAVGQQVNLNKQTIVDYGLDKASFSQPSAAGSAISLNLQATAVVGSELNTASLAKQVAGKKTSDATSLIKSNPGVTDVTIKYSPFWVMSMPKNANKITIHIDQPKTVSNG